MSLFPNILPADPGAPELMHYAQRKPQYGFLGRILLALDMAHERRQLAKLDDHMLSDIGVSRDEARREAARPAWDVPAAWKADWRNDIDQCLTRPGVF